jgi:hypothetical protein
MGNALVTAFGTASSSASLPVTINSLEQKNHIDPRISRYCIPFQDLLFYSKGLEPKFLNTPFPHSTVGQLITQSPKLIILVSSSDAFPRMLAIAQMRGNQTKLQCWNFGTIYGG